MTRWEEEGRQLCSYQDKQPGGVGGGVCALGLGRVAAELNLFNTRVSVYQQGRTEISE